MTPMPVTRNTVRYRAVGLLVAGLHIAAGCHTVCSALLSIATSTEMRVCDANTGVSSRGPHHTERSVAQARLFGFRPHSEVRDEYQVLR